MHILLTDTLTCPRCGPGFGLILLADRMEERRVLQGRLGCSNCREQYAIVNGAGMFGGPVPEVGSGGGGGGGNAEEAVRLAALLGAGEGSGFVLLAGPATEAAESLAAMLEGVEVVVVPAPEAAAGGASATAVVGDNVAHDVPGGPGGFGVSRVAATGVLPLATGKMLGAALTGAAADALLEEGARTVSPVGRLLLDPAPANAAARLQAIGWRVALHEGTVILATRAH